MIQGIINRINSYSEYLKSRVNNYSFPKKLKQQPLEIPDDVVLPKVKVKALYPDLFEYYPEADFKERLNIIGKVKSAAVVFNSGLILDNEWGKDIDNHDLVFRINFQPTKGYEKFTGGRTDIRVLGRNWLFRESNEIIIHTYNNEVVVGRDVEIFKHSKRLREEKDLYIFDNERWRGAYHYFGANFSNGLRTVVFALSLAEKVFVYGADPKSRSWRKGKKLTHFPSENDLEYVMNHMKPYSLIHQEYDRYFGSKAMNNGMVSTIHDTINREYMFYEYCPNVELFF
ncbi:MAG: glycosyltransferase family 29 protein [Cyclobacteriaceae bacterium]|nr:glycosyltransferase family 29 protein [Cyclobacteriaceae bacterium]